MTPKEIIKSTINDLKREGNAYRGMDVGSRIPNFVTHSVLNSSFEMYDFMSKNEFNIISFFRGNWCGYCKNELKDQRDSYDAIRSVGADLVAIAPQSLNNMEKLRSELDVPFDLVADDQPPLQISSQFHLVWDIPHTIQEVYLQNFDLNIPELQANNTWQLPVPALYIVDSEGFIIKKFEDLNYSKRMHVEGILNFLRDYSQQR